MLRRLVATALLIWAPIASAQLPVPVSKALAEAGIPDAAMSALVLRGDDTLLSHLAERQMNPASTIKVVTTLVALDQLGPAFRGRTELRTSGELVKDLLKGDLIVRGGADVDFDGAALEQMLRALRYQGIRQIDGRLVLDRQLFNPARPDLGLPPFDEWPAAYYNVIPDALLVNKNMLQLDMRSTGVRLELNAHPALERVSVESAMTLIDADCARWEDGWKAPDVVHEKGGKIRVVLRGTYPKNCVRTNSISVLDRDDYLDRLLRGSWTAMGGTLTGSTVSEPGPPGTRLLAEHVSRALPEIIRDTNKPSDNTLARTIFLSLGSLQADPRTGSQPLPPSTTETTFQRADLAVRNYMRGKGIDDSGMVMENGSGLSRVERINAVQMGAVLRAALRSNWAPEFQASLPIVGIDGTMRRRLNDSPAAQRARIKTGTLRNAIAVAGYVMNADGQQCVVVGIINSERVVEGKARVALDALIDWVARGSPATQLQNRGQTSD